MIQENQTQVSPSIVKICTIVGVLGTVLGLIPSLQLKEMPAEVTAFLGGIGDIAFSLSLVVVLLFTVKELKGKSEGKFSPVVIYILIGTLILSVIASLCDWGEQDSDSVFTFISAILMMVMLIVTGILFLLQTATKKIGLWMIGVVVGLLVGGLIAESLDSVNKLTLFIVLIIGAGPVAMMFEAFKNYLSRDKSLELSIN